MEKTVIFKTPTTTSVRPQQKKKTQTQIKPSVKQHLKIKYSVHKITVLRKTTQLGPLVSLFVTSLSGMPQTECLQKHLSALGLLYFEISCWAKNAVSVCL